MEIRAIDKTAKQRSIGTSFIKALRSLATALPVILGVILLLGLFKTFVTGEMIQSIFTGGILLDTVVGAGIGSISAGNPITSYIIGGELLKDGVSLYAVTSFMIAWVTVGLVQLPVEATFLGRRFAILRNLISFVFACLVSIAAVLTLWVVS